MELQRPSERKPGHVCRIWAVVVSLLAAGCPPEDSQVGRVDDAGRPTDIDGGAAYPGTGGSPALGGAGGSPALGGAGGSPAFSGTGGSPAFGGGGAGGGAGCASECVPAAPRPVEAISPEEVCARLSPGADLTKLVVSHPEEKTCHPDAGSASYVYLNPNQAIVVEGPPLAGAQGLCSKETPIGLLNGLTRAEGIGVGVGTRLRYLVRGSDYEGEVDLAEIVLYQREGVLRSRFLLSAGRDGVLHGASIVALLDGVEVASTAPLSIETRYRVPEGLPPCAVLVPAGAPTASGLTVTTPSGSSCWAPRSYAPVSLVAGKGALLVEMTSLHVPNVTCAPELLGFRRLRELATTQEVFEVTVKGGPRYVVNASGFDDEVDLARVEFFREREVLRAKFLFAAKSPGTTIIGIEGRTENEVASHGTLNVTVTAPTP